MRKDEYISSIFNYCDNWCEKCAFTAQCKVFVQEMRLTEDQKDINSEAYWEHMQSKLLSAMYGLKKIAKEQGIYLEETTHDYDTPMSIHNEGLTADQVLLEQETRAYSSIVDQWLTDHKVLFEEKRLGLIRRYEMGLEIDRRSVYRLNDAVEVIRWYQYFISAKVHRGLHGLAWMDFEGIDPIQNDANGSAKITLLAVDSSIRAWELVHGAFPDATDAILDILLLLNKIRRHLNAVFPHAAQFRRPGFDDEA